MSLEVILEDACPPYMIFNLLIVFQKGQLVGRKAATRPIRINVVHTDKNKDTTFANSLELQLCPNRNPADDVDWEEEIRDACRRTNIAIMSHRSAQNNQLIRDLGRNQLHEGRKGTRGRWYHAKISQRNTTPLPEVPHKSTQRDSLKSTSQERAKCFCGDDPKERKKAIRFSRILGLQPTQHHDQVDGENYSGQTARERPKSTNNS